MLVKQVYPIKIKELEIGEGLPTKIIAELGTLHLSSLENLEAATKECIDAGADMVKVQLIKTDTAWWASENQKARYKRIEWPVSQWINYFSWANSLRKEVPVFASIFDIDYLSCLNEEIPAWKLGFKARLMPDLVEKTISCGKPVIISLGDHGDFHSRMTHKKIRNFPNVITQYVQPIYPVKDSLVRLPKFGTSYIENDYYQDMYQGLSIHSRDFSIFEAAMILGAQTIEVHVQGSLGAEGPDTYIALNTYQLRNLVRMRDRIWQ